MAPRWPDGVQNTLSRVIVSAPPSDPSVPRCPGCGGRIPPDSSECDWCGRAFTSTAGRLRFTIWQVLSSLLLLGLIGSVALLAFLNAGRSLTPARVGATATAAPATVVPTPIVTPMFTAANAPTATPVVVATEPPTAAPVALATSAEPPTPVPTPTPQPQLAVIANTGGQGATVRQQPGPQAPRAGALREGTRVRLTGNDQTVAARPWREIETEDHNVKGWVLADFVQLLQSTP